MGTPVGEFMDMDGERWYAIRHFDEMPAFFSSIISDSDHWLFISSTGGLTAGRVSPDFALFPYITVDRIHESTPHTGSKTVIRVTSETGLQLWEPFNREHDGRYQTTRNLYKNVLGNKICFEETNHDLELTFRYRWCNSDRYGFVRESELQNHGDRSAAINILDGLQNLLPAGTPRNAQDLSSNLLDAYKWAELDESTGVALFSLFSALSDRAEPAESLRATTVFNLGIECPETLLSSEQIAPFRRSGSVSSEAHKRGVRGAYLIRSEWSLGRGETRRWQIVCGLEQTQGDVVALQQSLQRPDRVAQELRQSIAAGSEALARIMAMADAQQTTAEETVSVHHYANVLFNVLRGGLFDDQYALSRDRLCASIAHFNREVYARNADLLQQLPETFALQTLAEAVENRGDAQLERLCSEYLPITFGRRHGDPSRPWNQFAIRLKNADGSKRLAYEGNWRDIFQNWEALALSYPEFVEGMIAKFVNASTLDGYNPYRITSEGIDWEIEDPDDPWSYIGYWGDHQIIYLQKLLELSRSHHPQRLSELLRRRVFAYANVPYRLKSFEELLEDSKSTVLYDTKEALRIEGRVGDMGADGKLVLDSEGNVALVTLMEKLLVPLLSKLGNLVIDGGIWLNTQRPEWNDANNALVGNGLSMVTLYYLRRYIMMLSDLLGESAEHFEISAGVAEWLMSTASCLADALESAQEAALSADARFDTLHRLGSLASDYRARIYQPAPLTARAWVDAAALKNLLDNALRITDLTIERNRRDDGLFHAYNLLKLDPASAEIDSLYPMLEGQVAAISSGALSAAETVAVIEALFASNIYREDQKTFMLYPDRPLPDFLEKNRVDPAAAQAIPLLRRSLESGDRGLVYRDAEGVYRFSADFKNVGDLRERLNQLSAEQGTVLSDPERTSIEALYEETFNHRAFTGRSGGMFGFEGLGCIYWHMVSKLLLAVQEAFYRAADEGVEAPLTRRLGELYYRVRLGIGFNKTPQEYGAFPTDPYSHTPGHAGAQQPGMTGQVKEELLTRFGELGLRIREGEANFEPSLLREREFLTAPASLRYLDTRGDWQTLALAQKSLAFTWCQVPCVYRLGSGTTPSLRITWCDGEIQELDGGTLPAEITAEIFTRSGRIKQLDLAIPRQLLFDVRVAG